MSDPATRAAIRETHSAVVVLVGDRAYKFKKPVDLGFLDFRSEQTRREICLKELELNRRLAPDVYLDVVHLVDSSGNELEHGLLMRRMPESERLSTLIEEGRPVHGHLRSLARLLADFHAAARRGSDIAGEVRAGGLRRRWSDNLSETEKYRGTILTRPLHHEIAELALGYVEGRRALLDERADSGFAVDGHGDLIADDIFCSPDHPRVIDCIEFDDRLRWVDVLDDVCFLAMDLEHLGHADLAKYFLARYREFSAAAGVRSLEHHYIAYRAFVRAKVNAIQAEQGREGAAAEAGEYAQLALRHLRAGEVTLTLVGGPPGTGKSTLAAHLADRQGCVLLSSDAVRRDLSLPADQRYSPAAKAAVYRELLDRARLALEHGESVIADATWGDSAVRDLAGDTAAASTSRVISIRCDAPVEVAAARSQRRLEAGKDLSEAGGAIARSLAAAWEPWPAATAIDTSGSIAESVDAALSASRYRYPDSGRGPARPQA